MKKSIIWLNENALRVSHPIFREAGDDTDAIFIWDDTYFQDANYSLKRLVFIYETLCELPIQILYGDTINILQNHELEQIFIPLSINPFINEIIKKIPKTIQVKIIEDDPFVVVGKGYNFKRFSQYWNKAEKTSFLKNGKI